jgi:hypothetical protein
VIRVRKGLDDPALVRYLASFWQAWTGRRRKDGRPYDPGNLSWLTDWALNGSIPPAAHGKRAARKKGKAVEEKEKQFMNQGGEPRSCGGKTTGTRWPEADGMDCWNGSGCESERDGLLHAEAG